MQESRVQSLGQEDPLEKGMANHCSILAWRIPWTEEPTEAGYSNVVAKSETRLSNYHIHNNNLPWRIVPGSLSGSLAAGGQEDDTSVGSTLSVFPPLSPAQQQLDSRPGRHCGAFPDTAARALHLRLH